METKCSYGDSEMQGNKLADVKVLGFKNRVASSTKKSEYPREYRKLKLQEEYLEKSVSSSIRGMRIDGDVIRQITEEQQRSASERQSNLQTVVKTALSVIAELKFLKSMLSQNDSVAIQNLDVVDCKLRLTRLSQHIEEFRNDKQLVTLRDEEAQLDSDLRGIGRSVYTEKLTDVGKRSVERKCPTRSDVNDEFTELVARTGHTQGWTQEDHSMFLKVRRKCTSVPRLVTELQIRRPHLTTEQIVNHETWQKLYGELREKRKREIAEWRLKRFKDRRREETIDEEERSSGVRQATSVPKSESKTRTVCDPKKRRETCESVEKKRKIEEWRAEKARKSAMDEEQKKRLEKGREEEERRRRETARRAVNVKLREFKDVRGKEIKSAPILRNANDGSNRFDSLRLIKSFREQDEKYIRRRLGSLKVSRNETDDVLPESKSTKSEREISKTLFAPTKVWEQRCKQEVEAEVSFGRVNYVKDIKKLGAPRCKSQDTILR